MTRGWVNAAHGAGQEGVKLAYLGDIGDNVLAKACAGGLRSGDEERGDGEEGER